MGTSNDGAGRPELDESIDIVGQRIDGLDLQDVVKEHVSLERSHEEKRGRTRLAKVQHACPGGPAHVVRDELQGTFWWILAFGAERKDERRPLRALIRGDDDARGDDAGDEWNDLQGQPAEHEARIGRGVDGSEIPHTGRGIDQSAAPHGLGEECVLGIDVTENRRGGNAKLPGDLGQRGGVEAFRREDAARAVHDLLAADACWPSHL